MTDISCHTELSQESEVSINLKCRFTPLKCGFFAFLQKAQNDKFPQIQPPKKIHSNPTPKTKPTPQKNSTTRQNPQIPQTKKFPPKFNPPKKNFRQNPKQNLKTPINFPKKFTI